MCGIFGAQNFNRYIKLYNKNKERGNFAFGGLFLSRSYDAAMRNEGTVELTKNMIINNKDVQMNPSDFYYFLGHTQAPTSVKRTFDQSTSHPFDCGLWTVAHNGVLTNDVKLKNLVKDKLCFNEVDSSVIPALLEQFYEESGESEVDVICRVLSKLEGTFGLWIYCKESNNTYIARSGSTLYADVINNVFSSLPDDGLKLLEEGVLYLITPEGITSVGGFTNNSPFFIL
jgi:glucosamine 6-phosphate synthetase-like amidotransferase/phosphosugar isomerase protein